MDKPLSTSINNSLSFVCTGANVCIAEVLVTKFRHKKISSKVFNKSTFIDDRRTVVEWSVATVA